MFHQRYIQKVFQPRRVSSCRGLSLGPQGFLTEGGGEIKADGPHK